MTIAKIEDRLNAPNEVPPSEPDHVVGFITATPSWIDRHGYGTTRPSAKLVEKLEGFRMTPSRWLAKVSGVHQLPGL